MIRRNKDTEKEYSKKKKTETSGIKEVKDIKEKSAEKRKPSYGIVQSIFQTKAELTAETSM